MLCMASKFSFKANFMSHTLTCTTKPRPASPAGASTGTQNAFSTLECPASLLGGCWLHMCAVWVVQVCRAPCA